MQPSAQRFALSLLKRSLSAITAGFGELYYKTGGKVFAYREIELLLHEAMIEVDKLHNHLLMQDDKAEE